MSAAQYGNYPAPHNFPSRELPNNKPHASKKFLAGLAIGGTLTAGGIAAGVVAYETLGHSSSASTKIDGFDSEAVKPGTDYSKSDIASIPNPNFVALPYGVQIDKTARYFDKVLSDGSAMGQFQKDNKAANGYDMQGGIGTGSINDLPQEQANRVTVELDVVRNLAKTDLNLAENLVGGVFKNGTPSYDSEMTELQKIHDGGVVNFIPTTFTTFSSSKVFTEGSFAGNVAAGTPTQVYTTGEDVTGRMFDTVVQQVKSSVDPSVSQTVIVDEVGRQSSQFVDKFDNWTPSN